VENSEWFPMNTTDHTERRTTVLPHITAPLGVGLSSQAGYWLSDEVSPLPDGVAEEATW
jgi:hypothetical protein